ncbi:MAG: antibiotic biosynthesis monooxygenase [Mesorhizobium sp.]|nr:antibiotic biosynthesis monooxygenase [Mesorhizobium sp.]
MIAVIFEVEPAAGRRDAYLSIAAELRPLLDPIDGFISIAAELRPLLDGVDGFVSIERFQSLSDPDRILSLSFWRDEEAVKAWRNTREHRLAQKAGRGGIFDGYRLRIAHVVRDYGLEERREQAPADSRAVHRA